MQSLFTDRASLRRHVEAMAEEGDELNPYRLAEKILSDVRTEQELRVIAEVTFGSWVWSILKKPHTKQDAQSGSTTEQRAAQVGAAVFKDGNQARTFVDADGNIRSTWRQVDALVDHQLAAELNCAVRVGDDTNDQKRLGDCTAANLRWMAAYRRRMAAANLRKADECDRLDEALVAAGVSTVKDLPREVLKQILLG